MLYHFLFPLSDLISGLNLFRYITFRAGGAAVTALLISFFIGPIIIKKLRSSKMLDEIREDSPESHQQKNNTPTMGGLIILPATIIPTLLFARLDHLHIWLVLLATIWMGTFGFIDDYLKIKKDKKGLIPRYKLAGQITLGIVVSIIVYQFAYMFSDQMIENATRSTLPFLKNAYIELAPLGIWAIFFIVVTIAITATSNAVNLTDGLDGLAIGVVGIIAVGLGVLSYVTGHIEFSNYLNIVYLPGSGELAIFCGALAGAALGFLWFNNYPAEVIMGDTGALAIGAGIATTAILIRKEIFLIMLGGILVAEALSVLMQRYYFKYTRIKFGEGRRIFLRAPVHHHFELLGWHESKIVTRFWIVGILLLFLTLTSFKVR